MEAIKRFAMDLARKNPDREDLVDRIVEEAGASAEARAFLNRLGAVALADKIRKHIRDEAMSIRQPANPPRSGGAAVVARTATASGFLKSITIGDKWLADCTGEDLDAAIEQQRARMEGCGHKAALYERLRERVGDDQSVAEVFDDSRAEALWSQVRRLDVRIVEKAKRKPAAQAGAYAQA